MQTKYDEIRRAGAEIIAISSSAPEDHRAIRDRYGIEYPILSDRDGKVITTYGLLHSGALPFTDTPVARPAVFFIGSDGIVKRRLLTPNWRVRVRAGELLRELDALTADEGGEPR